MLKTLPFYIGLRYILARKNNRFISFTTLISMLGLTLGVLALVIVLSVFNGSQGLMRDRTLLVVPHAEIGTDGPFQRWQEAATILGNTDGVLAVSPYTNAEAMLSQRGYHEVAQIRGILPEEETAVTSAENHMFQGSFHNLVADEFGIILGAEMAANLRLFVGDPVNLVIANASDSANVANLQMHRFSVVGLFNVPFTLDANLAYVHIEDSKLLSGADELEDAVRLRLKVADVRNASAIVEQSLAVLSQELPENEYTGRDWRIIEASLFNALEMEKVLTGLMLMMIVAIGAFNIVSTLIMVVGDKKADIAILRTMGGSARTVMGIFIVQGLLIGISGTLLGGITGIVIVQNFSSISRAFENLVSPEGLYVISSIPARLQMDDVMLVCISALIISFLATLYPAWKASRILPAEVLRYE